MEVHGLVNVAPRPVCDAAARGRGGARLQGDTERITKRPRAPSGVAVFMSAHSKTPYIPPSKEFSSGNAVARGRRGRRGRRGQHLECTFDCADLGMAVEPWRAGPTDALPTDAVAAGAVVVAFAH